MNFTNYSQIWDLHIHTNKCPKGSSEFKTKFGDDTEEFINTLISHLVVDGNKRVEMISFTDHNYISIDVYKSFYNKKTNISLIPGIEIDCLTDASNRNSKHIIVYFECCEEKLDDLATKVNLLLKDTRDSGVCMILTDLFDKLIKTDYNFIVSPHAFKQEKRAIDFDWTNKEFTEKVAPMYMDQFFVFWEASGYTTIQKAKEFLESFDLENKISIISFSDSNNFEKLNDYLSNPPQFFHSLPTFRGLAMAGTDVTRIRGSAMAFDTSKKPGMIKEVIFDDIPIQFSTQLNAIIGGRGSGKSILIDSIAKKLGKGDILPQKRKEFLNKFPISIKNFNDVEIFDNFEIDYFNQAYVTDLFSNDNFGENLKKKFADSFSTLTNVNKETIKAGNDAMFRGLLDRHINQTVENLDAFANSYPKISNDGLSAKIFSKNKIKIDKTNQLIDYNKELMRIDSYFNGLPKQVIDNPNLTHLKSLLTIAIAREVYQYNKKFLENEFSINCFIDNYLSAKTSKTSISLKKKKVEEDIKKKINHLTYEAKYRNVIINAYFIIAESFKTYYSEYAVEDGSEKNRFIFSNELTIESPLDHLINTFNKYIDNRICTACADNLVEMCKKYICGDFTTILKEKASLDGLREELEKFDLNYSFKNNIYFVDNDKIFDIMHQSPGTKTNILMEYIVYKKTNKPLLIDQPEDNIDNKTIYDKLRKWFTKLKTERQVIVVTHDANIVINADAENVVIAEQISDDKFSYKYGALEFSNIISDASSILDGGKDAVKRRLIKYES